MQQELTQTGRLPGTTADFQVPLHAIATPTLVLDRDFTMVAANEARLRITKTQRGDIIGRPLFEVFPDNPNDAMAEGVRNLRASLEKVLRDRVADTMPIQKYDIPKAGSEQAEFEVRYWSPINIPILGPDGEVTHILHQVEDVTEAMTGKDRQEMLTSEIYARTNEVRSINAALKIAKEELEKKVAERTTDLLLAKEAAEEASRTKSAFLANMSHEIRTPLGAIMGFTELLKDEGLEGDERENFLDIIHRNGTALTRIIDDILDLAKVEAGRLHVERIEFSLPEVLSRAAELFHDKARQKGISLHLNIDPAIPARISSDPARLRQILVNLIGNAVKFTEQGGIRIDVTASERSDRNVTIMVDIMDTGIGLTDEQKALLFHPFSQADNTTTRRFGGTGLGLVLSQRLSEALGGHITIRSRGPGTGCTVTLGFPAGLVSPSPDATSPHKPEPQAPHTSKAMQLKDVRVLAVDDSPDNLMIVQRVLLKHGAEVDTAEDGAEAIEKALAGHYDLVLMDIQMPRMDGYESKRVLDERLFNKPIVALTAHAMKDDRTKTRQAGFSGHLTKPLDNKELIETVAHLVAMSNFGKTGRALHS